MTAAGPQPLEARATALHDTSLAYDLLVLRSSVAEAVLTKTGSFHVDVTDLTRPPSSAVAGLLWAKRNCTRSGVRFVVRGVSNRNREVLRRCGLVPDGRGADRA